MLLETKNFLSINWARLETDEKYAIIAGRNGCGKTHFLLSLCCTYGSEPEVSLYDDLGYDEEESRKTLLAAAVVADPPPKTTIYYPSQRDTMGALRGRENVLDPLEIATGEGLTSKAYGRIDSTPGRLTLQSLLSQSVKIGPDGILRAGDAGYLQDWEYVVDRVYRLVGIRFHPLSFQGPPLTAGFKLLVSAADGPLRTFHSLSTGEKEIASLVVDMTLVGPGTLFLVDEPELHLHPSLQTSVVSELIDALPEDAFLLIATHSPSILLRQGLQSTWWMDDAKNAAGKNQLQPISGSLSLTTRVFDLYRGCSAADSVPEILVLAQNEAFGSFLDQCYELPGVEPYEAAEDSDPQVAEIRSSVADLLLRSEEIVHFVDFGCGKGRCLRAFDHLPSEHKQRLAIHLVDPDPERLAEAMTHVREPHLFLEVGTDADISEVEKVNYVAAANVFHEITGKGFVEVFGRIWSRLVSGGTLHILEVGELLVGEKGFLTISREGYNAFFGALPNAAPLVFSHFSHSGIELIAARARKTDDAIVTHDAIRTAYVKALQVTKSKSLEMLGGDIEPQRRAFWLENLAAVDRTLEEMGAGGEVGHD